MSYNTFQPLEDRVLIMPVKKTEEEKTASGLIIDMAKKEVLEGEVYAAGVGRYASETGNFVPTVLGKGDLVLYAANQGIPIDIPQEDGTKVEMKLMREGDVLLLIRKNT